MTDEEPRSLYYSRQGRPLSLEEWTRSFGNMTREARVVEQTHIGKVFISTVWLGIDHNWHSPGNPPIIFETMVFGGSLEGEQWRYSTEEQALAGHHHACELVQLDAEAESDDGLRED